MIGHRVYAAMRRTASAGLYGRLIKLSAACLLCLLALPVQALVILQYHHIDDSTPAATSTSPVRFEEHLEIIADSGFRVMDLVSVAELLRQNQALPDKAVLITFDDSYSSIYETAFPLLKERGWPFVIFANTEPVDAGRPGFMTWPQLREMGDAGAAVANHSVHHPHLVRRPENIPADTWRARVQGEIRIAEARIYANTGQRHKVLAFPYGEYDAELLSLLEELGYLGMSQSSGAVARGEGLALPRFPLGGRYGEPGDFSLKLHALPLPLSRMQLLDGDGERLGDGLLPGSVTRPVLELKLQEAKLNDRLQCYATGQTKAVEKTPRGESLRFQTSTPLPAGRSRYNCTARHDETGRYHWLSVPFLRPNADGSWPPEP